MQQTGCLAAAGQDVVDHEVATVIDKSEIGENAPHRHACRHDNDCSHRRGYLSGGRKCGMGTT